MTQVVPLPSGGMFLADARGADRLLRVTWHPEAGCAVLSIWRTDSCVATFRLPVADVPELIKMLADGLAEAPSVLESPLAQERSAAG